MKTCGIEIDNDTAIIVVLEKYDDNTIEISEHSTKLTLTDHESSSVIKEYVELIYSQLDTLDSDRIGIIKRQIKGPYAAGGLSFKIESIIQTYKGIDVELIPMPTIKAFIKKNSLSINVSVRPTTPRFLADSAREDQSLRFCGRRSPILLAG